MVPLSSSIVSQFLIAGLVVGAVPYTVAKAATADEDAHRPVAMAAPSSEDLAAEHRYLELAEATTVETPPTATVEQVAIALAASLAAVPVGDLEGAASCPAEKLTVSWEEPSAEHTHGAYVTPLGPAPGPDTDEVNGVVLCEGYPYAFMGFEAAREGDTWDVVAVPFLGADDEELGEEPANDDADGHDHEPAEPTKPAPPAPRIDIPIADLGPIEGYAAYEPQRICHPTAKPGTDALRRLLTGHYTSTRNLGIARGCTVGGRSEHKEGRAFDWGAYVQREVERKSVEDLIGRLLATDEAGNRHALARRMGVMYIIWNQRIWSAYRSDAGWRPYGGRSPHTDHAHISLSWDGAMGRTSFWTANGVQALFGTPAGTTVAATKPVNAAPAPADDHPGHDRDADDAHADRPRVTDEDTKEVRAERDDARKEYEKRIRAWREARERRREEREQRRAAGEPLDEQSEAEVAAREAEKATEEAKEALDEAEQKLEEADDNTEKAERRAEPEADRANRRAEWRAERESREQAREERQAEKQAERQEREARKQTERQERETRKQAERDERKRQREERDARKQTERQERDARKQAERDERKRQREERDARKQTERQERDARKQAERDERKRQREERDARKQTERQERDARKQAEREERRRQREERHRQSEEPATPPPAEAPPATEVAPEA